MAIPVVQIGFGQQGKRNVEKIYRLKKMGYNVDLVGVIDTNLSQLDLPFGKIKEDNREKQLLLSEIFPRTIKHIGRAAGFFREYPGSIQVAFDSTWSSYNGIDIHAENMAAFLERKARGRTVYATNDTQVPVKDPSVYNSEKPFTASLPTTLEMIKGFKENGVRVLENAVESFMPTKIASVEDIKRRGVGIKTAEYARMSAVQSKMIETKRLIPLQFGGAWYDKTPHDIVKFLDTYHAAYNTIPDAQILNAAFDPLIIKTRNGEDIFTTRDGKFTREKINQKVLNEAYAEASIKIGETEAWFASSHVGIKPHHLTRIESWFTPEIKTCVAEVSTNNGRTRTQESVMAAYGNNKQDIEARVERIICTDGSQYVTQTFGKPVASFFTARVIGNEVDVLQEGWTDGHLLYVKNALDVALGIDVPKISANTIELEAELLSRVDRVAKRGNHEVIDLSDPKLAEFIEPELRKFNII